MRSRIIILSLTLLTAAAVIARASRPESIPFHEPLSGLSMQIGDWKGQESPAMESKILAVLGVDDYIDRVYYNTELFPASLYVGYYKSQREGDAIHSPLNCLPGAGWNPVESGYISLPVNGNSTIKINRIRIVKGIDEEVVLYWYQSHGRVIASEYWAKIYSVLDALHTNRTDAALVRVICPVPGTGAEAEMNAEKNAVEFVKALFPCLSQFLPR
jgi:EpsI family protein